MPDSFWGKVKLAFKIFFPPNEVGRCKLDPGKLDPRFESNLESNFDREKGYRITALSTCFIFLSLRRYNEEENARLEAKQRLRMILVADRVSAFSKPKPKAP